MDKVEYGFLGFAGASFLALIVSIGWLLIGGDLTSWMTVPWPQLVTPRWGHFFDTWKRRLDGGCV
ncbi:hypothetical protein [Bradyrhizobium erythrophlei]|uniref:hypothetical protein n=1 Tax=Bradyrhizobium erythrophlei TaxID=1437360 RepID=UPI000B842788|nr:hypothetical protein [Bradyrhizobium erythrophlei]